MLKKIGIMLIAFSFIFCMKVKASSTLTGNQLLKVNEKIITSTTSIDEVNNMFGTPKVETKSAFGGKAYSYFDDNYSYYLYLETDSQGSIKSYGAIGGNFVARKHSYGDPFDGVYSYMTGNLVHKWKNDTIGVLEYNNVDKTIENEYWNRYLNDTSYLYELQKHAIHVAKAVGANQNYSVNATYISEKLFYQNEQLKKNNSNIQDYAKKNGKETEIQIISDYPGENLGYLSPTIQSLPNAIKLGSTMGNYTCGQDYLFFDAVVELKTKQQMLATTCVEDSLFTKKKKIELTEEEKAKMNKANESYLKFIDIAHQLNQSDSLFLVKPVYETLPLVAGTYKLEALQGSTYLLNTARIGIGLEPLTLSEELSEAAQAKATLTMYISFNKIQNPSPHYPKKPDGVDEEFYNKAQSYMNENLYSGGIDTSINYALHDGYGDPIECGHRYNLLNPYYAQWGVGSTNGQGAHKFSGGAKTIPELVAWPSNGAFPLELVYPNIGNWTAKFYKNYNVTDETNVTIKNLTTGKKYEIVKDDRENGKLLKATTYENMVTFRDDTLIYGRGDVFEITLHNIKNNATDELVDYTYRSVFYNIIEDEEVAVNDITISESEITLKVGEQKQVTATILPVDANNKLTDFTAVNNNIATIRQDGMVTAVKPGKTKIKITSGTVTKEMKVNVQDENGNIPDYLLGDFDQNGIVQMNDVIMALRLSLNIETETDEKLLIGDIDGDGEIKMNDVISILRISLNLN